MRVSGTPHCCPSGLRQREQAPVACLQLQSGREVPVHIPTAAEVRAPAAMHLGADRAPGDWVAGTCPSFVPLEYCPQLVPGRSLSTHRTSASVAATQGWLPNHRALRLIGLAIEEPLGSLKTGRWELCCPPGPSVGSAGKNARSKVLPRTVDYTISQLLQGVWLSINLYLGTAEPGTELVSKI